MVGNLPLIRLDWPCAYLAYEGGLRMCYLAVSCISCQVGKLLLTATSGTGWGTRVLVVIGGCTA